mgnify:CR=1 FL=1|jgi:hypothetical protein
METIFNKIESAIKNSGIKNIKYLKDYPKDHVKLVWSSDEILDDESIDTITPLIQAMEVINNTIKENADSDEDIEVTLYHLPGEEEWGISIGDGR